MAYRIFLELISSYHNKGFAVKKKETLHNDCKLSFFSSKG